MSAGSLDKQYNAIRFATALARTDKTHLVRLRGEGAHSAAHWLLPSRLHLRDAQARQSLLLNEHGHAIADVLVASDDEEYLLLIEGHGDLIAHLQEHTLGHNGGKDVQIEVLDASHEVIEIHGPWAWELVSQVLGEDLLALPYLNFFRIDEGLCLRAGRTGEFGYHVIVPRDAAESVVARFRARGAEFDLEEVSDESLSLAAFENWFFDADHIPSGATPVELSLSWRLARGRDFLGRDAVAKRRETTLEGQVCVLASGEVHAGDRVVLGDRDVGYLTRAAFSPAQQSWFASGFIEKRFVFAGIELATSDGVQLITVAPPLVNNQSLYIDPRRHAYRDRHEVRFGKANAGRSQGGVR